MLVSQNVIVFEDKVFKEVELNEVIRVGPIQYDWCPYKKKRSTDRHTKKKDHVKAQEEGRVTFKSRREVSKETNSANALILGFQFLAL